MGGDEQDTEIKNKFETWLSGVDDFMKDKTPVESGKKGKTDASSP